MGIKIIRGNARIAQYINPEFLLMQIIENMGGRGNELQKSNRGAEVKDTDHSQVLIIRT